MGLYDDKLNPTYEDVLVAFLPIKSVKIKYVIIKGAKKKPMHKKLHMGVSKQRDYVSGEEETKSPGVCHCGIDKYTADFTKDCCRKKKKYRQNIHLAVLKDTGIEIIAENMGVNQNNFLF